MYSLEFICQQRKAIALFRRQVRARAAAGCASGDPVACTRAKQTIETRDSRRKNRIETRAAQHRGLVLVDIKKSFVIMKLSKSLSCVLLVAAGALSTRAAMAAPVVHEAFDYAAGSGLVGNSGGSGFGGAWQNGLFSGGSQFGVAAGSLAYPGLAGTGNSGAEGSAAGYWGARRSLATSIGADGTTAYLSFLIRGTAGANAADFFGLYLEATNPASDVFIGKDGGGITDRWVIERRGGQHQVASDDVIDAMTTLLVLRMDFAAGADTFSLFVNPQLGAGAPAADAVNGFIDAGAIAGIGLFGSRGWSIDEIRIGDTLADVTPAAVPEPATWTLSLVALLGLLGARRRAA
jgi:hypothetical protein